MSIALSKQNQAASEGNGFRFVFPLDGDCLNRFDGVESNGVLMVRVRVAYPDARADIYVNGEKAFFEDGCFSADIALDGHRNTLFAENLSTGEEIKADVCRLSGCTGRFELSSDDNILFLAGLNRNKDKYISVFDDPYLRIYKKAHDLYGAKCHLNLFYSFDRRAAAAFSAKREAFDLSMMTDKFRDEFVANSDWLQFSFHAISELPDSPYQNTTHTGLLQDIKKTHSEIIRFAGEKSLSDVSTLHWGASNLAGVRALRQAGYKGLRGYFKVDEDGNALVSYHYPSDFVRHLGCRDFWRDNEEDVVFGQIDTVLNSLKPEQVIPALEQICSDTHRSGFVSVMIHEQYFYADYMHYIPEFEQMVLTACSWLKTHGYTGAFMSEALTESKR